MGNDGLTDTLRKLNVGDTRLLTDIERPNIHALATRVGRKVSARKQKDGSFVVTCIEVYGDLGELVLPESE